jgi:plasmid stabilization system protein ParE
MKVDWDPKAKEAKHQVAAYIRKEFGTKRAKKFKQEVDDTVNMLMRSPFIGKLDPLFEDRPVAYRSVIINGLNKMIYRVEDDVIYIAGFWDTRMDDEDQATQVK